MDLIEQDELAKRIGEFCSRHLLNKTFKAAFAISDEDGNGFSFSIGNLSQKSSLEAWRVIVAGVTKETDELADNFNLPADPKLKKPIEPKW